MNRYFNLLMVFVFLMNHNSYGNSSNSTLDLKTLIWTKNWDFKARSLSVESGTPSKVDMTLQPRINRLDFYGFLGSFPSSQKNSRVGFALANTILKNRVYKKITLMVSSTTPDLLFRITLSTKSKNTGCNLQTEFQAPKTKTLLEFYPKDFKCVKRGVEFKQENEFKISDMESIGFLITRSNQKESISKSLEPVPFELQIHKIKIY